MQAVHACADSHGLIAPYLERRQGKVTGRQAAGHWETPAARLGVAV